MKFCPNCGAPTNGQSKFCAECGAKLSLETAAAPVVQEAAPAAPVQAYEPPAAPVQAYEPPTPPAQAYEPPAAPAQAYEPPAAPAQAYEPPAAPAQSYQAPAQSYQAPVAPKPSGPSFVDKVKTFIKERKPLASGIGAGLVLVILAAILIPMLLGGGGSGSSSDLGKYECTSISMMGMEFTGEDLEAMGESWIELKKDGKCTIMLMDDKIDGTWSKDGEKLTFKIDGEKVKGTLKDGKLVLTIESEGLELKVTFQKKGGTNKNDKDDDKDTNLGKYGCTYISVMGMELSGDDLALMGESWLELKDGGKCIMMLMDDEIEGTWSLSGKKITVTLDGEKAKGSLEDGILELTLEVDGETMELKFDKNAAVSNSGSTDDPGILDGPGSEGPGDKLEWWNGDWYGWWVVADGTGAYEEWIGGFWDSVATITLNDDGTGTIIMWDEDGGEDSLIISVEVEMSEGFSDYGCLVSVSGNFLDSRVGYYDWMIDSDGDSVSMFDNMICITGTYQDPNNKDTFDYEVYLRPWGMEWDDVEAGHADAPYDDMMPGGYYTWYLPLIQKGEDAPTSFEAGEKLIG